MYCNSLLYGTTSQNIQRLQLLQNHAAKLVYNKSKFTRVTPLMDDLHWLSISKRIEFKTATLAYKALHNEVPVYLSELLHIRQSTYNLRSTTRIVLTTTRTRTTAGRRAFNIAAPQSWNSLPTNVQSAVNTDQFKKLLKTYLFQK